MKISITCESCGHRHRLERPISRPGPIWIVCHDCELPLQACLDPAAGTTPRRPLWAGLFESGARR